jgi:DNA mismatch repair protein MSH5
VGPVQYISGGHGTHSGVRRTVQTPSEPVASGHDGEVDEAALDALAEVIMAVDLRERGTVGCCYYVAREEKLYCIEDVRFGGIEVIDTCKWRLSLFCPCWLMYSF